MKFYSIDFRAATFASAGLLLLAAPYVQGDNYDFDNATLCWGPDMVPAIDYLPYYNTTANTVCETGEPPADSTQCGRTMYGDHGSYLNWIYGSGFAQTNTTPGTGGGINWLALDGVGKSMYAPHGLMLATFKLGHQGVLRDPHWHSNSAEITYIYSGTARVTVAGLPSSTVDHQPVPSEGTNDPYGRRSLLRGSGNDERTLKADENFDTLELAKRKSETFLLQPGDAFYSPVGYHHYFEGVDPNDPLIGIAMFDTDGLKTFDTPQMMKYIDNAVLNETLGIDNAGTFMKEKRREVSDPHDGWSPDSVNKLASYKEDPNLNFKIGGLNKDLRDAPRQDIHGKVRTKVADANWLSSLKKGNMAAAITEIPPGGRIEPYWIDNADELIYVFEGEDIEIVRAGNGKAVCKDVFTVEKGYLALLEIGVSWYITNKGDKTAVLFRTFNSNSPTLSTLYDAYYSMPEDVRVTMLTPSPPDDDGVAQQF